MKSILFIMILNILLNSIIFANTAFTGMRDLTSFEIVEDMRVGWNLGNTLDVEGPDETFWGNPYTTQEMIDEVAAMGFKTLRVPVTWRFHMGGEPDYTIESEWLDRVEEVANYGFENDMYVIINIHHDDPWIIPTYEMMDTVKYVLDKLWTQIANRFKDYGDYLIFETMNEPRHEGSNEEWTGGTAEGRDVVNQYHDVCVDAIRATGGNNTTRQIMISTYAASSMQNAMNDLIIPNGDTNTIVSIHTYFPYFFTLEGSDKTWCTNADKNELNNELDRIYSTFTANDIPVVLGEWCNIDNNNYPDRLMHADYYTKACAQRGFTPIWWDAGGTSRLLNRRELEWITPEIIMALTEGTLSQECTPTELTPFYQKGSGNIIESAYISSVDEDSSLTLILDHDNSELVKWVTPAEDTLTGNEIIFESIALNEAGSYKGYLINDQGCKSWEYFKVDVKEAPSGTVEILPEEIIDFEIHVSDEIEISYSINQPSFVHINIISLSGTIVSGQYISVKNAGTYSYTVSNNFKQGVYIVSIKTTNQYETDKFYIK